MGSRRCLFHPQKLCRCRWFHPGNHDAGAGASVGVGVGIGVGMGVGAASMWTLKKTLVTKNRRIGKPLARRAKTNGKTSKTSSN